MAGSHLRTHRRVDRRVVIVVIVAAVVGLVIGACVTWFLSDDLDLVAPFEPDVAGAGALPDRSAADTETDPVADPVAEPTAAGAVPDPWSGSEATRTRPSRRTQPRSGDTAWR